MPERPNARYTREKTWAALYTQAINACYALVPNSATNNSIHLIRCKSPEETRERMKFLLSVEQECAVFFSREQDKETTGDIKMGKSGETPEQGKLLTFLKNAGEAVI